MLLPGGSCVDMGFFLALVRLRNHHGAIYMSGPSSEPVTIGVSDSGIGVSIKEHRDTYPPG